ncbi:MAG TPA: lasso peptide biosynthesis B2 protein [Candidatus Dormibacteraeota bacterium]|nr:lasso peptide biosynthesis B2 protein [Candidatus Dormibacteraeota bacterium]
MVLLRALALLLLVRAGLRMFGWRRVQAALAAGRRSSRPYGDRERAAMARARRTARLVAVAARLAGGTCLARSLVLAHILDRLGIPAELRIGVRNADQKLEAHAWVEMDGVILNDGQDMTDRFAAFDRNFAVARVNGR